MENTKSKTAVDLIREQRSTGFSPRYDHWSEFQGETSTIDFRPPQNSMNAESVPNEWEYISSSDINPSSVNRSETKQNDLIATEKALLQMQLDDAEQILKRKDEVITTRDAQKARLYKTLGEKENALAHKTKQVLNRDVEIEKLAAEKVKEIANLNGKMQDLHTKLSVRTQTDEYVKGLEKDLRRIKGALAGQKAKDEKIALLTSKLDAANPRDKDLRIAFLSRELHTATNSMLEEKGKNDREIAALQEELRQSRKTIDEGEKIAGEAVDHFHREMAASRAQEEKCINLEKEINAMHKTQIEQEGKIAFLSTELANANAIHTAYAQKDERIVDLQKQLDSADANLRLQSDDILAKYGKIAELERDLKAANGLQAQKHSEATRISKELEKARTTVALLRDENKKWERCSQIITESSERENDLQIEDLEFEAGAAIGQAIQRDLDIAQLSAKLACANEWIQTLHEQHLIDLDSLLEQKDEEIHALTEELDVAKASSVAQAEQIPVLKEKLASAEADIEEQKKEGEKSVEVSEGATAELKGKLEVEKKMAEKKIEYIKKLQTDIIVAKEIIAEQGDKLKKVPGAWRI